MSNIDFPFQTIDRLTFSPRPQPLSASLRPLYRIALIVLVLKTNCNASTASLLRLQFFNWLLKSPSLQELIKDKLQHQNTFTLELIHIDPMVNLALKYAFADNLISITSSSKYKLTDKGHEFANQILRDEHLVLIKEREILEPIGKRNLKVKLKETVL